MNPGAGSKVAQAELGCFIGVLFQDSETYQRALKLYTGRYEVIGCKNAADILREAIEKYMPDRSAVSEEGKTEEQTDQ